MNSSRIFFITKLLEWTWGQVIHRSVVYFWLWQKWRDYSGGILKRLGKSLTRWVSVYSVLVFNFDVYLIACTLLSKDLFIWKAGWQREGERQEIFHLSVHFTDGHNSQVWSGWNQETGTHPVLPHGCRGSSAWHIFYCLLRRINKELDLKWNTQNLNWFSCDMLAAV